MKRLKPQSMIDALEEWIVLASDSARRIAEIKEWLYKIERDINKTSSSSLTYLTYIEKRLDKSVINPSNPSNKELLDVRCPEEDFTDCKTGNKHIAYKVTCWKCKGSGRGNGFLEQGGWYSTGCSECHAHGYWLKYVKQDDKRHNSGKG